MQITVIGATGKAGRAIAEEAARRGHEVRRISRSAGDVTKDALELTRDDLGSPEVVVDALGFFTPETLDLHTSTVKHLADLLAGSDVRLLIVGGAGSLYTDTTHTVQLVDTDGFPAEYRPLAQAQTEQLAAIRTRDDVAWTFVSPAADFQADGECTGEYVLAGEELETNAAGASVISYADYAIAMVDLVEDGGHLRERVSVHSA